MISSMAFMASVGADHRAARNFGVLANRALTCGVFGSHQQDFRYGTRTNRPRYSYIITAQEILRLKEMLNGILAEAAGKTLEAVTNDTDRDHFMSAEEAKAWGIVDKVL